MAGAFLLSILVGPVVPVPLPRVALEALEEIEVTQKTEGESGFSLKFSIDAKSVLHTLLLVGAQITPALRVIILVTIGGLPQVLMDGVIDRQEMSGGGGGQATLTVLGKDLSSVMNRVDKTGLPYPAMPVPARVLACIGPYAVFGMIPVVIPPLLTVVKSPTSEIPKHKGTDLAYLRQMAKENGYVFYVDPGPAPGTNTAYFGPEIRIGIPQPALTMNADGFSNVSSVEFAIDGTEREMPILIIQEPNSKVPLPIPLPGCQPRQSAAGAGAAAADRHPAGRGYRRAQSDRGGAQRSRHRRQVGRRGKRERDSGSGPLWRAAARARAGRAARRGARLRRPLFRQRSDDDGQDRVDRAEIPARAQRADLPTVPKVAA